MLLTRWTILSLSLRLGCSMADTLASNLHNLQYWYASRLWSGSMLKHQNVPAYLSHSVFQPYVVSLSVWKSSVRHILLLMVYVLLSSKLVASFNYATLHTCVYIPTKSTHEQARMLALLDSWWYGWSSRWHAHASCIRLQNSSFCTINFVLNKMGTWEIQSQCATLSSTNW